MIRIVQRNGNKGIAERLPEFGSRENNVLHTAAAQLLAALLPKYPANGICHIALAASVWTHYGGDSVMEGQMNPVGKRFKTMNLNIF